MMYLLFQVSLKYNFRKGGKVISRDYPDNAHNGVFLDLELKKSGCGV
jgi:hypothetical protein